MPTSQQELPRDGSASAFAFAEESGKPAQTAEELYADTQTPATKRAEVLATLADALTKTVAANKRMMPQASALAQSVHTLQLLTVFTTEHFPQHAAALAEIIEPFGEVLEKSV